MAVQSRKLVRALRLVTVMVMIAVVVPGVVIMIVIVIVLVIMVMFVIVLVVAGTVVVPSVPVSIRHRRRLRGTAAGTRFQDFGLVAEAFDLADDAIDVNAKTVADRHCPRHNRDRDVFNPVDAACRGVDFRGAAGAVHSVNAEARIHADVGHPDAPSLAWNNPTTSSH